MKDADIEILREVKEIMRKFIPLSEYDAYAKFLDLYERMKAKNDSQKRSYQAKAEHYRESSRKWRQENKDRNREYQRDYNAKKRAAQKAADKK